jgi:hypothetical protein
VYLERDDIRAADDSLMRILDLSPVFDASTWALRGRVAEMRGRFDEAGRSVVEARAFPSDTESWEWHVASSLLADGQWVKRSLERSREIGDLVSKALELARADTPGHHLALETIIKAAAIDVKSQHVDDGIWQMVLDMGGWEHVSKVARAHFSGPTFNYIRDTILSRVENAQSARAT